MYWTPGKMLAFQRRLTTGGPTFATLGATNTLPPRWLRLDRAGDTFTAYQSVDAVNWVFVGTDTIVMPPTVHIGMAAASMHTQKITLATFDSASVTPGPPTPPVLPPTLPPLPDGWSSADIGSVGFTGGTTFDPVSSTFSVKGAGNDVWGTADAFQYAYRVLNGDGFMFARLKSLQNTSSSAKAGVMIRESLAPGSANAFMLVTQGKGTDFQRRQATGAVTVNQVGTLAKAPLWVGLQRYGDTFYAYQSADGATWTLIGTDTIPMGTSVYIGLAATSHNLLATTVGAFDSVWGSW
jgi:regulation of enolase protein 1 (concanavalin A-like superfamily)